MQQDLNNLVSGTDVRGTATAGVENDPVTLTDEAVTALGKAFLLWLLTEKHIVPRAIAVGHDSRLSAEHIEGLLAEGLSSCGCNVILTGLSSTPSMFMLLQEDFGADASVMITASHLPYQKNGLKFFVKEGGLENSDVKEIVSLASAGKEPPARPAGTIVRKSYIERYAEGLVRKVQAATGRETPLAGKKIVVDAGGGAGGFYADLVLKPLGADTAGSQFLEPDGRFPDHIPNPENEAAMQSVCEAVLRSKADFGIIFDTDVDRAAVVSPDGKEINRNRLIALISAILLEERAGVIVTDSVTSDGLSAFIKSRGGVHRRFKRGYKNVINESKRLNAEGNYSPLAIETSGHAALAENYFLDDGAYLVTRLLIALAKSKNGLMELIADLPEPAEAGEARLSFKISPGVDFKALGAQVIGDFGAYAIAKPYLSLAPDNFEGMRVNFGPDHGNGWALVRMSLHEPIMPVNLESNERGGNKKIAAELVCFLKNYSFLDLTQLEKFL